MELCITFDMRAPAFGALRNYLYDAALDQVAWADDIGVDLVGLGEHHGVEDGYNPSPLVLASAMAARTRYIKLRTSVVLAPLYDLTKLAEDAAVTQILSNGRLLLGLGAGYRPSEFESFGRKLKDRWKAMGETCEFLRQAWLGEPFEWQGRTCCVTPRPEPFAPPILLGGSSPAAARRAAHIADGWFPPLLPELWQPYRDECIKLGNADPGPYPNHGPVFMWVTEDPDRDWATLYPHVEHQMKTYSQWTAEAWGEAAGPYAGDFDEQTVRQSPAYQVLTPEQVLELAEQLGPDSVLYLNPLLAGIDPRESWRMLRLFEDKVLPHLPAAIEKESVKGETHVTQG
jgi:alkanesulfonate monooxygenase SsuD/methylene tetrahydromethanopterin reductase-like flavin-dependent oxidoreductase (luciferase family)